MASSPVDNMLVEVLLDDIKALSERDYPEIGVPTILIGEECSAGLNNSDAIPLEPDQLASQLITLARLMSAARSPLSLNDVGQLLELLADRHFFDCGSAPFSTIAALHPPPC